MIESHFESKLNHTVQRASPFQYLCGFQNDGIFRVPSRALFIPIKVVETLMIAAFHLFYISAVSDRVGNYRIIFDKNGDILYGFKNA